MTETLNVQFSELTNYQWWYNTIQTTSDNSLRALLECESYFLKWEVHLHFMFGRLFLFDMAWIVDLFLFSHWKLMTDVWLQLSFVYWIGIVVLLSIFHVSFHYITFWFTDDILNMGLIIRGANYIAFQF